MRRRDFIGYGLFALTAPAFAQSTGRDIVSAAIHPAMGIARIGNSPDGFFIGPEIPGRAPRPEGGYKDAQGRMKRQAVRFRIFGYDAQGRVVREITAQEAQITWTAEVANTKSAWYEFRMPLDIPEATRTRTNPPRRNPEITGEARRGLAIRPGPRSVSGANQSAVFDRGQFMGRPVPLGEMRTDEAGRLLFLGGHGQSTSPRNTPINNFANNDGWHDDASDGPVDARVVLNGREIPVEGAWVFCGPPAFAPGLEPMVTLYDLVYAVSAPAPRVDRNASFAREIYPIFERHARHQWVNAGFARDFGHGSQNDFLAPATLARLADPSAANMAWRKEIFRRFRDPMYSAREDHRWPPYYGDQSGGAREHLALLPHQHFALSRWAEGDFDVDVTAGGPRIAASLDEIPLGELPGALDRAAMDAGSGGPHHPGIESSWIMRQASLYSSPFRLRRRAGAERDYGDEITPEIALGDDGPLRAMGPGDVSRWMAVPWQADFINCGSAYDQEYDRYLPAYWPTLSPNDSFLQPQYEQLMAAATPAAAQQALAVEHRQKWWRGYNTGRQDSFNAFIERWHQLGVIQERPGPAAGPARVWVEAERSLPEDDKPE
ncbi:MAG: LodA/GoxA family CTQ-dependent oxidase [Hyphomonadaceae bacterium]